MKTTATKKLRSGIAVACIVMGTAFTLPANAGGFSIGFGHGGAQIHFGTHGFYGKNYRHGNGHRHKRNARISQRHFGHDNRRYDESQYYDNRRHHGHTKFSSRYYRGFRHNGRLGGHGRH